MLKRKLDPSTDARDFSIRSCPKDLRLRRVISPGSDWKGIKFTENGGSDIGSCEASGGKDPIMDKDLIKGLDKDSSFSGGPNKTGYWPRSILKKPNGSGWDRDDPIQSTPPENVITVDNDAASNSQNTFTKSRARVVPCSRQKLVQVPGSFSYKRLLPYLMEMDKNEVQVSSTEEKACNRDADSPNSILCQNLDFSEIPVSNTPNSEKQEDITSLIVVSTDAQLSEISKSENISSNSTNCTVEHQPPLDDSQTMEIFCSPQLIPSPSVQGTLTIDELPSGNVHKRGEIQTLTKMGEIKRDSAGSCKGICMCLDCVLFRTNAERSFEFSKRQLNEADEVVRGLVTEICSLRRVLEKFNGNRGSDCSQVYQDELIKAACERASLAEKIATLLTKRMYMDLDAHCKRPEAMVEFSDCIDQRIIPSSLETIQEKNRRIAKIKM